MIENRWLTKEEKKLLSPHAAHYSAMYFCVSEAADDDLAELSAACRACTEVNCGWTLYEAAQHLLKEIKRETYRRSLVAAAEPPRLSDEIRWADDGGRQLESAA